MRFGKGETSTVASGLAHRHTLIRRQGADPGVAIEGGGRIGATVCFTVGISTQQTMEPDMTSQMRMTLCSTAAALLAFSGCAATATTNTPPTRYVPATAAELAENATPLWSRHSVAPGCQIYLGPTGARGWICESQIVVSFVPANCPAAGLLHRGDVIVTAGGKSLADDADPRRVVGDAVTAAETQAGAGKLRLDLLRAGRPVTVTVPIRVMGSYSPTWPYDCAKSRTILADACRYLAARQYPDGHVDGKGAMATSWAALLWLASDDPAYLDNARRAAYWLCEVDYTTHYLRSWACGYGGMAIAEYFLQTGDAAVLPKLQEIVTFTESGQMASGTWGHNIPWGAYGGLNQAGLACWIMLTLSDECGLKVNPLVHANATRFFSKYIGRGGIPYGDHLPTDGNGSNGKDGLGSAGFALLGNSEGAEFFAKLVAASYRNREYGHTGHYFSLFWGAITAEKAGPDAWRTFLEYQRSYYDMVRTHDGGLGVQPNAENLSGRTAGSSTWFGPRFTTGGVGLLYALPRKAIRILGAPKSVFGAATKVSPAIASARERYLKRDWIGLTKDLAAATGAVGDKRLAAQLAAAAARQRHAAKLALAKALKLNADGDTYYAKHIFAALQRRLGRNAPELDAHKGRLGGVAGGNGERYYKAWAELQSMQTETWHLYGRQLETPGFPIMPAQLQHWRPIAPDADGKAPAWRLSQWAGAAAAAPAGWHGDDCDDSQWARVDTISAGVVGGVWTKPNAVMRRVFTLDDPAFAAIRLRVATAAGLKAVVYLNGTPIIRLRPGGLNKRPIPVDLPAWAAGLLVAGENVLAMRAANPPGSKAKGNLVVNIEGLRKRDAGISPGGPIWCRNGSGATPIPVVPVADPTIPARPAE